MHSPGQGSVRPSCEHSPLPGFPRERISEPKDLLFSDPYKWAGRGYWGLFWADMKYLSSVPTHRFYSSASPYGRSSPPPPLQCHFLQKKAIYPVRATMGIPMPAVMSVGAQEMVKKGLNSTGDGRNVFSVQ